MNLPAPTLRILVCGNADRGDDGAAIAAVAHVLPTLDELVRERIEIRRCQQLDPTDLIDVPQHEACLVLDTVVGVDPGTIVTLPLETLIHDAAVAPRSSHALPIEQVLGIAEAVRGHLPHGKFLGIGGKWFGFGATRSRAVREGLPAFEEALTTAIGGLLETPTAVT